MRGFRDIEDLAEDLRSLPARHWLVPASIISAEIPQRGLQVIGGDALDVGQEAVLLNQPHQMLAVGNQAQEQLPVQGQVLCRRILAVQPLFFLAPKQLHFVEPDDCFTVKRQLRVGAKNHLDRRTPAWLGADCLHEPSINGTALEASWNWRLPILLKTPVAGRPMSMRNRFWRPTSRHRAEKAACSRRAM